MAAFPFGTGCVRTAPAASHQAGGTEFLRELAQTSSFDREGWVGGERFELRFDPWTRLRLTAAVYALAVSRFQAKVAGPDDDRERAGERPWCGRAAPSDWAASVRSPSAT